MPRRKSSSIAGHRGAVALDAIPDELKSYDQWVVWRWVHSGGKPTKKPFNARTGTPASTADPSTWSSFDEAVAAVDGYDGPGFVLSEEDPFVGGDLDHCVNQKTGVIEPWARAIVSELNTYAELSPSGSGIRFFARGTLLPGGRKRGPIEIYDRVRFLTVTGRHVEGTPTAIEERTAEIKTFHARIFGVKPRALASSGRHVAMVERADDELIASALASRDGNVFRRLWTGDLSVAGGDHSAADLMFCNKLAFWTGGNPERVDRLFRRSALFRPKWDKRHFADGRTYGQATVAMAIAGLPGTRRRR